MMGRKLKILLGLVCLMAVMIIWTSAVSATDSSKNERSKICVGVFDSRAVACAHFGKFIEEGGLEKIYSEHAKAEKQGNAERAKQLASKAQQLQKQIHMRVFGTAAIDDILAEIENQISDIAQSENLDIVINKWDITYQKPSAKFVDITAQLVNLFEPDKETLDKIESLLEHEPVPQKELKKMDHLKD